MRSPGDPGLRCRALRDGAEALPATGRLTWEEAASLLLSCVPEAPYYPQLVESLLSPGDRLGAGWALLALLRQAGTLRPQCSAGWRGLHGWSLAAPSIASSRSLPRTGHIHPSSGAFKRSCWPQAWPGAGGPRCCSSSGCVERAADGFQMRMLEPGTAPPLLPLPLPQAAPK